VLELHAEGRGLSLAEAINVIFLDRLRDYLLKTVKDKEGWEILAIKLTQVSTLYNIKLALKGEYNPSNLERLVDSLNVSYGSEVIDELSQKSHAELRSALKTYGIIEIEI
jgi:hypothetical protein